MERLEGELRRELSRFGPAAGMPAILEVWSQVVGEQIAANAWPARIARDGTLHVATSSSTWAFELGQFAPVILERLRAALGNDVPSSLRFALGQVLETASAESAEVATEPLVPGPAEERRAAELVASIDDEELRKSVQRAVALSLARAASDRRF